MIAIRQLSDFTIMDRDDGIPFGLLEPVRIFHHNRQSSATSDITFEFNGGTTATPAFDVTEAYGGRFWRHLSFPQRRAVIVASVYTQYDEFAPARACRMAAINSVPRQAQKSWRCAIVVWASDLDA